MKSNFVLTFLFALILTTGVYAGGEDNYYDNKHLLYEDHVYKQNIHTAYLTVNKLELAYPAIQLFSEQKFILGFDDFETDFKTYNYTVIHCDADWVPTDISPSDYIDGYQDEQIGDIKHSFNTRQPYTHYQLIFPTEVLKITKSGNYLLKVYQDGNPDDLVITKRLMIFEQSVQVIANVHAATISEDLFTKQEVDFSIFNPGYEINDPMNDIKVVLLQNDRFDNAVSGLKPMYVKDKQLEYDFDEKNVFDGGKEFRWFDTKNLRDPNVRVNKIRVDSAGMTHIHLYNDDKRAFKRYSTESDINGKYVLRTLYGDNPDLDADYCYVHFYLMSDAPLVEGNVYLFGGFTNWQCLKEYRMDYNEYFKGYIGEAFLKQGFYNYEYVYLKDKTTVPTTAATEGDRYETENDYTILVYHKPIGVFYDKLIAYTKFKANNAGK